MPSKHHRIRFYADECIPIPSVTYLREKGLNVIHVYDKDNLGKSDSFQLKYSKKLSRVFLSLDKDVKQFDVSSTNKHPGVILLQSTSVTPKSINQVLDRVIKYISEQYAQNSLIKISLDKIIRIKDGKTDTKNI